MTAQTLAFLEDPASEPMTMLATTTAHRAITTPLTTILSLPQELRDLIYSHLDTFRSSLHTVQEGCILVYYTFQSRARAVAKTSDQLAILHACRRLWEEGSRMLYRENLFRFLVAFMTFNASVLIQKTASFMQDIEISSAEASTRFAYYSSSAFLKYIGAHA